MPNTPMSDGSKTQRRGRRIALTDDELDAFLSAERTCRLGSIGGDGTPHVTPLWYAWDGSAVWLNSLVRSQRWTDIAHNPNVSVLIDGGVGYSELIGVEVRGLATSVGEVPRAGEPVPELEVPERLFASKYTGTDVMHHDGRHAWLKIVPAKVASWDFRKRSSNP